MKRLFRRKSSIPPAGDNISTAVPTLVRTEQWSQKILAALRRWSQRIKAALRGIVSLIPGVTHSQHSDLSTSTEVPVSSSPAAASKPNHTSIGSSTAAFHIPGALVASSPARASVASSSSASRTSASINSGHQPEPPAPTYVVSAPVDLSVEVSLPSSSPAALITSEELPVLLEHDQLPLKDLTLTPLDILEVRSILRTGRGLPANLVDRILELGEYWVRTSCSRKDTLTTSEHDGDSPYIRLPISSFLRSPVRKIIFSINSYNQGCSQNEQGRTPTSFEACIMGGTTNPGLRREIQGAVGAVRTNIITWNFRDSEQLAEWMGTLTSGQVLGVYPRDLCEDWKNIVEQVDVYLYCAWV